MIRLYKTYVKNDIKRADIDPNLSEEYVNQKVYLEKSVAMLKKNLMKDQEIHKQDNIRIMRDNVELIQEIKDLRDAINELKFSKNGDNNKKKGQEDNQSKFLKQREENSIMEKKKLLELLKKEINEMTGKVEELEKEGKLLE